MTNPTMRASVLETFGEPLRLRTIARPTPEAGQVLVRVVASGVNPLDVKVHAGAAAHARVSLPAILGMDVAGVVEEVGPGVTGFAQGDEVYGLVGGIGGLPGTLAEFVAVDAALLAPKPAKLSMREAAALPLVAITAWEGLVDRARVAPAQKVLVLGGGGGVGLVAVQIAKALGAEVFASDGASKAETMASFGAVPLDRALPVERFVEDHTAGEGFDVVYDTAGGTSLDDAFRAVRSYGHVVSALGWGTHALAPLSFRGASYSGVFTLLPMLTNKGRAHHGEILREISALASTGKLRPRVDPRTFTLETVDAAHAIITARDARGKLVVDVAE